MGLAAAQTPRRIVSVGGALTETLYALGAQAGLVGVDTTSLHPGAARALPSVGYARSLSAEGVLSLRPTLVVATEDAGPPAVLRQLEAAGVPLSVLQGDHRIEGVLARTQRLAELSGRPGPGRALVAALQRDWQATQERVAKLADHAPRVMFVLSHIPGQARVAGRETAADAMLRYAGAANALGRSFSGYKPLTPEGAIAAAPDVILATEQGLAAASGIEGLLLLGFGPRLPQATAALAELLHARA